MKAKDALLLAFLLLPTWAWAHGEEIIIPFFIQAVSTAFFLIAIVLVRLPYPVKALLVAVYLFTTFLVWCLATKLPFRDNLFLINMLVGTVPIVSTLGTLGISIILQQRRAKRATK